MNYLAHGYRFLERPYLMAGTAAPDWMNVVDRRTRLRAKAAREFFAHSDWIVAEVAAGIVQHHVDDAWFHQSPAFVELQLDFSRMIRGELPHDDGMRPWFLAHILVEILLDWVLSDEHVGLLDSYYDAIGQLNPAQVQRAIETISGRADLPILEFIHRFRDERFLDDYADDERLLARLQMVMRRVGLPPLPEAVTNVFPDARRAVKTRWLQGDFAPCAP